jgi:hypothetical protein
MVDVLHLHMKRMMKPLAIALSGSGEGCAGMGEMVGVI